MLNSTGLLIAAAAVALPVIIWLVDRLIFRIRR